MKGLYGATVSGPYGRVLAKHAVAASSPARDRARRTAMGADADGEASFPGCERRHCAPHAQPAAPGPPFAPRIRVTGAASRNHDGKETPFPVFSFSLTADGVARLRTIAAARGVSVSWVVREAVALALDHWGDLPSEPAAANALTPRAAKAHSPTGWPRDRRRHAAKHGVHVDDAGDASPARMPTRRWPTRGHDEADLADVAGDSDEQRRLA